MATVRITEADLIRNIEAVLAQVRQGAEVVVQSSGKDIAVMRPPIEHRTISESLAIAESLTWPVLDEDFAKDVMEGIAANDVPWDPPEWD